MRAFIAIVVVALIVASWAWLRWRRDAPKQFGSTQEMMTWLSEQAVDMARENHGVVLDYSPQSIEKAEYLLGKLHDGQQRGKLQEGVNGLAMAFGAYIGEVIRRSEPGASWGVDHDVGGPKSYPLRWRGGDSFPMGWCYKRIVNGEEDNVWVKYQLLKQSRAATIGVTTQDLQQ